MRKYGTTFSTPKLDDGMREYLWMKSEEKADIKRGTPGVWVQNGHARPIYLSAALLGIGNAPLCAEDCADPAHASGRDAAITSPEEEHAA